MKLLENTLAHRVRAKAVFACAMLACALAGAGQAALAAQIGATLNTATGHVLGVVSTQVCRAGYTQFSTARPSFR